MPIDMIRDTSGDFSSLPVIQFQLCSGSLVRASWRNLAHWEQAERPDPTRVLGYVPLW